MNVALDLDGTLINCESRQTSVLQAALTSRGMRLDNASLWRRKREGANTREALMRATGDAMVADQLAGQWQAMVEDPFWLGLDSVLPGVPDILAEMRNSGAKLQVFTARSAACWVPMQLARLGLDRFLDAVVVVSPIGASSSKADLLRNQGIELFFGDTESDYIAATTAAVPFLAVSTGQRSRKFLSASGVPHVFDSLRDAWRFARQSSLI